jgi:hypothetical protein
MGWPMVYRLGLVIVSSRVPTLDLRDMICALRGSFSVPSWRFWLSSAVGRSSMLDGLDECSSVAGTIKRPTYILPTD